MLVENLAFIRRRRHRVITKDKLNKAISCQSLASNIAKISALHDTIKCDLKTIKDVLETNKDGLRYNIQDDLVHVRSPIVAWGCTGFFIDFITYLLFRI